MARPGWGDTTPDPTSDAFYLRRRDSPTMSDDDYRVEEDSLGEMRVPADVYWGAQTQRAVENFPISGLTFGRRFVRALGVVIPFDEP